MIRSMTGFGAAELGTEHGRLSAEVRSVNHRYCEISLRLPRSISGLEGPVRQLLTDRLARGKINLSVSWEGYEDAGGRLTVNHEVARQYIDAMAELKAKYGLGGDPDVRSVVALGDVFQYPAPTKENSR